jgi:Carboxypeptidase regulatory-like domain
MKKIWCVLAIVALSGMAATAGEQKSSDLHFLVIKDYNGKPVRNASVVLHPVKEGKQERGGFQLKTDNEGRTGFDGVPYGILRVQVLCPGFQTFGEDYDIKGPTTEITIKLKRPSGQYSIYDDKNPPGKDQAGKDQPNDQKPK